MPGLPMAGAICHGHRSIFGINSDQIAYKESRFALCRMLRVELKSASFNAQKQRVTDSLSVLAVQVCQHPLQASHGGVFPLPITQFQERVALHLLNRENGADRPASLSHHCVETPVTADGADHRSRHNPVI